MALSVRSDLEGLGSTTDHATLRSLYFALLRSIQPDVCCDIGANDGQAALLSKEAAPRAEVFAFEANPEIYRRHEARLRNAGIHYQNLAVSDRNRNVTIYAPRMLSKAWIGDGQVADASIIEPAATGKTSLLRRNEDATYQEFTVPAQELDEFFARGGDELTQARYALWIDAEGAASAVLSGAKAILKSTDAIFIEVENYPFWKGQSLAAQVTAFLRERGFVPAARDREYGDDQFNILFVPETQTALVADLLEGTSRNYPSRDMPVIVPAFNNPTYLRQMIQQLHRVGLENVIVVDNASEYPPQLEYLASLEARYTIIRRSENNGPRHVYRDEAFYEELPQFFCITDPDLTFNPALPADFLQHLIDLTVKYQVGKAGFALDVSQPDKMLREPFQIGDQRCRIWEWEAQFWQTPLEQETEDTPYRAFIDTTFAVYNKEFFRPENYLDGIRVAGRFTARHLPWYSDPILPAQEDAFYRRASRYSFYTGQPPES